MPFENLVTMHDMAARIGANGDKATQKVVELQSQTNALFQVLGFKPCNDGTKETVMLRNALPDTAWRMLNKGTKPTKSATEETAFTCGALEDFADVDERMMKINKNSNTWRLSENYAHQEAMAKKMATTFFYGDEKVNPASFTGLSAFYYSKSQNKLYADQIVDCGGTGDNLTSLWIMTLSDDTLYGIHPETIPAGYQYRDMGMVELRDKDNGIFYGYRSKYNWDMGIALRDPRYVVRMANIDVTKFEDSNFIRNMIDGYNRIHNVDHGRTVIMCNRQVQTYLAILASEKANVNLRIDEFGGKKIEHFWTSPILRCDAILSTESQLV